ncbi:prephenate dehydratase domain-containing protein [uncultured Bifidobacterium sp.]|uniref:prephenate dehydratase n=1 Tax=uncultured Bifidobacterium sp. TaxID=165187 RepID=UPI0026223F8A|nr:prephenate dehydratase domain-containing protein [uncultured Bifidobacterium sp.]
MSEDVTRLLYLGPQGSFTHEAAQSATGMIRDVLGIEMRPVPASDVPEMMNAVQSEVAWSVMAWENNVEGYVVPNLDALIDSENSMGILRVSVDVSFDAFVLPDSDDPPVFAVAHPHGLAQCRRFIQDHGLREIPTTSNAAACRDLQPGQVALAPAICGPLYGARTWRSHVQDYAGARTDFLVIAPRNHRERIMRVFRHRDAGDFETVVTFIPLSTGPGVLADLLDVLRDAGLNMTSFISRPIKGHDGTYSFIATLDSAPWDPRFNDCLRTLVAAGDWVKTLAVYPRRESVSPPVDAWMLPRGGVRVDTSTRGSGGDSCGEGMSGERIRRELLW